MTDINARFRAWRERHFPSLNAAALHLGLDRDTLTAIETGMTRNGNPYHVGTWVEYMMAGKRRAARRKLTTADIAALLADIERGMILREAAGKYGITVTTIRGYVKAAGLSHVTRARTGKAGPRMDLPALAARIEAGQSLRRIARETGHHPASIIYQQKRGGLPLGYRQKVRP